MYTYRGFVHKKSKVIVHQVKKENNIYHQAFWNWWPTLYQKLHSFRITGGEPLLNDNTFKIIDYISIHKKSKLNLAINTNLAISQNKLTNFLDRLNEIHKKVNSIRIYTSLDSVGIQAEYIRFGLKYNDFLKNVTLILKNYPKIEITFMSTFNLLSLPKLTPFLNLIYQFKNKYNLIFNRNRVQLDLAHLDFPYFLSIKLLPPSYAKYFQNSIDFLKKKSRKGLVFYKGFTPHEVTKLYRIYTLWQTPYDPKWITQQQIQFYRFINEYDRRRNTLFLDTFPELKDFWNQCRNNALNRKIYSS